MKHLAPAPRGSGRAPTDPALIATRIDGVAAPGRADGCAAQTVLWFLNGEWAAHQRDEADGLFPLLARRGTAEDDILMPRARVRRTRRDLLQLPRQMRARRGLPPETGDDGC